MTVYNKLHSIDLGRVHLRQIPRVESGSEQIAWEIRACFGATHCMRGDDPLVGMLRVNVVESGAAIMGVGDVIIEAKPLYGAALCEEMPTLLPMIFGAMTK